MNVKTKIMDPQFIVFGIIMIFIIAALSVNYEKQTNSASICSKKSNETCIQQNECCSHSGDCCTKFCHRFLWFDGRCVNRSTIMFTKTAELASSEECKRLGDNTCTHHNECCSRKCFKETGWKVGICKRTLDIYDEYERSGRCSYYDVEGGLTASGEPFRPDELTAAHRTLPFNTTLRVTTYSGRSVVVRVNDRGPFKHGRILDLSKGAAEHLGMLNAGVIACEIRVVEGDGSGEQLCMLNWDNTCEEDDECCSGNCDRPREWALGVCKPAHLQ